MTIQDHAAQRFDVPRDDAADVRPDSARLMPSGVFTALLLALVHAPAVVPSSPVVLPPERAPGNPHALAFWL